MPFNNICSILEDADGILWLTGPLGKTDVALFNPLTKKVISFEKQFAHSNKLKLRDEITDQQKTIYLTQEDEGGAYIYKPSTGLHKKNIKAISPLNFLHLGPANTFYAVSKDSTLLELDTAFKILNSKKFSFKIKKAVHGPRNNGFLLWEITDKRTPKIFYVRYPFTISEVGEEALPPHDPVAIDFILDAEIDSIIWRQGKLYNRNKELLADFVKMGFKDLSGNLRAFFSEKNKELLWIGNNFGLYKITVNKNKFKNYFTTPLFNEDNLNSFRGIFVSGDKLYGNKEAKGLCISEIPGNRNLLMTEDKDFGGYTCLVPDANGNILQGCFYGLNKININTGKSTAIRITKKGIRVWCLYNMGNEIYLAGTEEGILFFDNKNNLFLPFEKYNTFKELKQSIIISITRDKENGFYWLCSNSGLYKLEENKGIVACYSSAQKGEFYLPSENMHSLYQDSSGITWIANAEGLIKWDKKNNLKKIFTRAEGLSNNTIYALFEDPDKNLWLSSDYGIMCFNKQSGKVKTYLAEDGISNNEFNRISTYQDKNGMIYFGSLNGITSFDPKDFSHDDDNEKESPFIISSFIQYDRDSGKLVDKTSSLLKYHEITVHPDDKLFTLEYVLLNYNHTGENLYAHKIDGVNDDWLYSKEHTLSISSLPYGEHTLYLRVKAVNTLWSQPINILIKVTKPFYLQAWFFITLFIAVSLVIYAVFLIRTKQYRKTQLLLKREVRRQTATIVDQSTELKVSLHQKETLLKEIHHRVKNNLQVISGLLSLQGGDSQSEELKAIMKEGRNRVKSMALIHQMLYQNENLNQVNFQEYIENLTKEISLGFKEKNSMVDIKTNANSIALDVDTAIPLGLIINELVTNSFKYAFSESGGTIEICLEKLEENTFRLIVQDSGKGLPDLFDINKTTSLGLKLVKMLCTQLRAKINFDSATGTKAEIIFTDTWKK